MLDTEIEKLLALSRQNGFMRGLNFAADIARESGHIELAIALRRQVFQVDVTATDSPNMGTR